MIFILLFILYSIIDFYKKEIDWWLLLTGFVLFCMLLPGKILLFLLLFALFYLIYQFVNIGGADVIVLALIGAILGIKLFIVYLVVLSILSLLIGVYLRIYGKKQPIAFIPVLTISYFFVLIFSISIL